MTRKYLWILLCAVFLLLSACQKAPELTVTSASSIELSADGSSGSITFTANRDWSASASDSWVSISPSSGTASDGPVTVTVRCSANTTYDDRTATVTIRMEELSQTVTIRQPANLGIVLATQAYELASEARTLDITVQSNVEYKVAISGNWIKQTGTKALTTDKLTFSIEENKTYDAREGTITLKSQNGSVADQVITVRQAQKDVLIIKDTSFDMPYGGGGVEIKVEANVEFDVKPGVDWIQYVETKALSNSTIYLTVKENETYSAREGKVEITQKNGSLKHTVTIKQAGRIAVTSVELDQTGLTIKPEETATLVATVKPDNASDKTVSWSTSDAIIATVDDTGKVTGVKDGFATITAKAGEKTASCKVIVSSSVYVGNAVDLGIIMKRGDGTAYKLLLADCNLGTDKPEGSGDYYAWGETEIKPKYDWTTYKWANGANNKLTKYCQADKDEYWDGTGSPDGKTCLDPEDDVAHVKLGGKWRMPTLSEWFIIQWHYSWTQTSRNGVSGYEIKNEAEDSNSVFIPTGEQQTGYWSSTLGYEPEQAFFLNPDAEHGTWTSTSRARGFFVRPVMEEDIPVTSIELDITNLSLKPNEAITLVATIKPDEITNIVSVIWSSSDSEIATVDNTGKVKAIKEGTATITAKAGDKTAECKVTVCIPVSSITLNKTALEIKAGKTATLVATVKPDNATDKTVVWSSSDTGIATVDETGKVTAVKEGTVTITAKAGYKDASCAVTVLKPSVYVGNAVDLGIIITKEDGSAYKLLWADSNLGTDTPEEYGDYYAWGEMEEKVECSWITYKWANGDFNKLTKYCLTNRTDYWDGTGNPDGKTVLDPEDDVAHVRLGGQWRLPLDAEWAELLNTNNCSWTWTTQKGVYGRLVTSKKNGYSIFLPAAGWQHNAYFYEKGSCGYYWSSSLNTNSPDSAVSVNLVNRNYSYRCYGLSVRPVLEVEISVTSVTLNKASASLNVGDMLTLKATITPDKVTNKTLTWTSSDPTVASVTDGLVQALKVGETTITVKTSNGLTAICSIKVERENPDNGGSEGTGEINW